MPFHNTWTDDGDPTITTREISLEGLDHKKDNGTGPGRQTMIIGGLGDGRDEEGRKRYPICRWYVTGSTGRLLIIFTTTPGTGRRVPLKRRLYNSFDGELVGGHMRRQSFNTYGK